MEIVWELVVDEPFASALVFFAAVQIFLATYWYWKSRRSASHNDSLSHQTLHPPPGHRRNTEDA